MRGQVSTELLIIVGLILLVFIPLLALVYFKANEANQQMAAYEAEMAVFRLAYLANSAGSLGTDTVIYTDVYIPKGSANLTASGVGRGGEVVMVLHTDQGDVEIVEVVRHRIGSPAAPPIQAEPSFGWTRVEISSDYDPATGEASVYIRKA